MDKVDFINEKINKKEVAFPRYSYKYRPFDSIALDMLDNKYCYLCSADNLDDSSECKVDFSIQDFYDLKSNRLTFKGIEMILEYVKPYTSEDNFQHIKSIVARTLMPQGTVRRHFLLDASCKLQDLVPNMDISSLINWLAYILEKMNNLEIRNKFMELFSLAYDARRGMGICSLSEVQNSEEMWQNYADNSRGYCIEYDLKDYQELYALFPVIYQDERETNIIANILSSFIGEMIYGMSYGQILADKLQFVRMFLTKNLKWSYQKEWRLLGDANQKLRSPSINAIYFGANMGKEKMQKLKQYCIDNNFLYI